MRSLKHYVRNEDDQVPDEDRFNAGQKGLFWGFLVCGILLFLSGLVLWEPHWIPWSLRFLRLLAVIVHPIAALLTIALFMIHVYMGHGGRARRLLVDRPRRRVAHLGGAVPPALVRAGRPRRSPADSAARK